MAIDTAGCYPAVRGRVTMRPWAHPPTAGLDPRRSPGSGRDRVARWPARERVDGVDLDEPLCSQNAWVASYGGWSAQASKVLASTTLAPVAASSSSTRSSSTVPSLWPRRVRGDGDRQDLRAVRRPAGGDGEPGDGAGAGQHPAVVAGGVPFDPAGDIAGEVVRQAADDGCYRWHVRVGWRFEPRHS